MDEKEIKKDLIKRLGSGGDSNGVRLPAWDKLFGMMSNSHYLFFAYGNQKLSGTNNWQDAYDLAQDLYLKIRHRLEEKPLAGNNVEGYIWRAAENLLRSYWRLQRRTNEISLEELNDPQEMKSLSVEEELELKETARRAQDLYLRLPDQKDRLLMLLVNSDFELKHILCLVPSWGSLRTVQRHLTNIRKRIHHQWERADEGLARLSPWEEQLAFTGDYGAFGISYLNDFPKNLAPESLRELCKFFESKEPDQLPEVCVPLLLVHNIKTTQLMTRICFVPRNNVGMRILDGMPMHYLDGIPVFYTEKVKGVQRDLLYLEGQISYQARMERKLYDDQYGLMGLKWLYDLPAGPLVVYKPFDAQLLHHYSRPQSHEKAIFVFQPAQSAQPS